MFFFFLDLDFFFEGALDAWLCACSAPGISASQSSSATDASASAPLASSLGARSVLLLRGGALGHQFRLVARPPLPRVVKRLPELHPCRLAVAALRGQGLQRRSELRLERRDATASSFGGARSFHAARSPRAAPDDPVRRDLELHQNVPEAEVAVEVRLH